MQEFSKNVFSPPLRKTLRAKHTLLSVSRPSHMRSKISVMLSTPDSCDLNVNIRPACVQYSPCTRKRQFQTGMLTQRWFWSGCIAHPITNKVKSEQGVDFMFNVDPGRLLCCVG